MILTSLLASLVLASGTVANSWGGNNLLMLQGMEESAQVDFMKRQAADGNKVLRLWVRGYKKGCEKGTNIAIDAPDLETELGKYNDQTLDVLDRTLGLIQEHGQGMKVIISPHNANAIYGLWDLTDVYTKFGPGFYNQEEPQKIYDDRLQHIFGYTGKHTGKAWKDFSEVILAFDLQNEPFVGAKDCPNLGQADKQWACTRATNMRKVLNKDCPNLGQADKQWACTRATNMRKVLNKDIKIATGGLGGAIDNKCTFMAEAMSCDAIDAISVHSYPGQGGDLAKKVEEWKQQKGNKLMYVEELGIEWRKKGWDIAKVFSDVTTTLNSAGVPWMSWMLIPDAAGNCKDNYNSDTDYNIIPLGQAGDIAKAMSGAAAAENDEDWGLGAGGSGTRPLAQGNGTSSAVTSHTNGTSPSANGTSTSVGTSPDGTSPNGNGTSSTGGSPSTGGSSSSGETSSNPLGSGSGGASSSGNNSGSSTSSSGDSTALGAANSSDSSSSSGSDSDSSGSSERGSGTSGTSGTSNGDSGSSNSKGDAASSQGKGNASKDGASSSKGNSQSW